MSLTSNLEEILDHDQLTKEYFHQLRNNRTLAECSEHLGVSKSTVQKWESGQSKPTWSQLCLLLELNGYHLEGLKPASWNDMELKNSSSVLDFFLNQGPLSDIAKVAGLSRNGIYNIVNGEQSPRAITIFKLWHHYERFSFLVFLEKTAGLSNMPSTQKLGLLWDLEYRLSLEYPFFSGVVRSMVGGLQVSGASQKLAVQFDVDPQKVDDLIEKLIEEKVIHILKDQYYLIETHAFDSRANAEVNKQLQIFWTQNSLRKLEELKGLPEKSFFNYCILDLSPEAYKKVCQEYNQFYAKVRAIASDDKLSQKNIHSLTIQFVDLSAESARP